MTEQIPLTLFIVSTKRKRDFMYNDIVPIHFVTIRSHKFFGWKREKIGDNEFRISDKEKTIVDSLDLLQHAGGITEVAKGLIHELNWNKIIGYTDTLGNRTVHKRLGYLIEALEIEVSDNVLKYLRSSIGSGYSWLDPTAPKKVIKSVSRWRLKINVPPNDIRSIFI